MPLKKSCKQSDQRVAISAEIGITAVISIQFRVDVGQMPCNHARRDAELFGDFGVAKALLDPVDGSYLHAICKAGGAVVAIDLNQSRKLSIRGMLYAQRFYRGQPARRPSDISGLCARAGSGQLGGIHHFCPFRFRSSLLGVQDLRFTFRRINHGRLP